MSSKEDHSLIVSILSPTETFRLSTIY